MRHKIVLEFGQCLFTLWNYANAQTVGSDDLVESLLMMPHVALRDFI